jgi:Rps23 Pro-64 3,4-dihydroxylase Tpa1-like proline 4-hydroxylase
MKIYKNVLSPFLIYSCLAELNSKIDETCWFSSLSRWPKTILVNVQGTCLVSNCSPELSLKLQEELINVLPSADKISFGFYVWQKNSGISLHNDEGHKWGATLYLNKVWHLDYGGIFLWIDQQTQELKAQCPEFNQLIVNTDAEQHMVTPVGFDIPSDRYTIQIWGS